MTIITKLVIKDRTRFESAAISFWWPRLFGAHGVCVYVVCFQVDIVWCSWICHGACKVFSNTLYIFCTQLQTIL